jgi:hypothetical protein
MYVYSIDSHDFAGTNHWMRLFYAELLEVTVCWQYVTEVLLRCYILRNKLFAQLVIDLSD